MVVEGFLYMWKVLNVTMLQSYNVTKCSPLFVSNRAKDHK